MGIMLFINVTKMIANMPFAALRAFEAVVRLSNFSAAAAELGVSQSAVSQHVKTLEEWLGPDLLLRGARRSEPTREGKRLARAISDGLGGISDVCVDLKDRTQADRTVVISCLPGFAFTWLFPRLLRFDLAHPLLSISIATDMGQEFFSGADVDVGIRYGVGDHPGLHVERLMAERLFPVCAPALRDGSPGLRTLSDLAHHTLLRDENLKHDGSSLTWEYWAREVGVSLPEPAGIRRFGQSNMVIQAAIECRGVALGREPLVVDAMRDGKLVRPFPEIVWSPHSYWLVCRKSVLESAKVQDFMKWIREEAAGQPGIPPNET